MLVNATIGPLKYVKLSAYIIKISLAEVIVLIFGGEFVELKYANNTRERQQQILSLAKREH